jgi:hypothetical protein
MTMPKKRLTSGIRPRMLDGIIDRPRADAKSTTPTRVRYWSKST